MTPGDLDQVGDVGIFADGDDRVIPDRHENVDDRLAGHSLPHRSLAFPQGANQLRSFLLSVKRAPETGQRFVNPLDSARPDHEYGD